MICQATRTELASVELPSHSPDGPYHLSCGAAERLQHFALRPLEWFNLATIHGPSEHFLHDDFYYDNGEAVQPRAPVIEPERFPCPSLAECAADVERLLDFALTRWHFMQAVADAFLPYAPHLLGAIEHRWGGTANRSFHERLAEIASEVLERRAEEWFRDIITKTTPRGRIRLLHAAYKCLSREEGTAAAQAALSSLPTRELAQSCLVLANFQNPTVLDWIETHLTDPIIHHWGDLAAASGLTWDRAAQWLQMGRPFSLVALDALAACRPPRSNQSFVIQKLRPRLHGNVQISVIEDALLAYSALDRSPRVSQAVRAITASLQSIVGPG